MERYGLLDEERIRRIIVQNDLIHNCIPVTLLNTPRGTAHTVRELWEAHEGIFFATGIVDHLLALIDAKAPEYSQSAREYFESDVHIGYNCYVMRWELFDRLCRFQFPIMESLTKDVEETKDIETFKRTPGYAGEMLFGIFVYHIEKKERRQSHICQLLIFDETQRLNSMKQRVQCIIRYHIDQIVWKSTLTLFPLGSERREKVKQIYLLLTRRSGRK